MDVRLVKEYRDAVEYIRSAAETLEQLREGQFRGLDDGELLSELGADRIRRTTNLCMSLIADLDAGRVKNESKGVSELFQVLERLHDRTRPAENSQVHSQARPFSVRARLG